MHNREDYDRFLAEVRKETGIGAMVADESGLVTVRVDDKYNVNLQFVEATGKILCFVEVAQLPADAQKAVYRDLLVGGLFGKDTAGGYFALGRAAGDVEEFVSTLEKILQLCEIWAERIRRVLAGEHEEAAPAEVPSHDMIRA